MELIAAIPVIGPLFSTLIPFLIVLGIVVFIHEYGHYIVGRWCGIHAEVFSIGFGKVLWSGVDRRGTKWQLAALPLGGYVKFLGDTNPASVSDGNLPDGMSASDYERSFPAASVGRRALTVLAGPMANFLLSTVVFAGLFLYNGKATEVPTVGELRVPLAAQHDLRPGDEIVEVNGTEVDSFADIYAVVDEMDAAGDVEMVVRRDGALREVVGPYLFPALVGGVQPLSPASNAGLQRDDLILAVADTPVGSFIQLRDVVLESEGVELLLTVLRDGAEVEIAITPEVTETPAADGGFEKRVMIGVGSALAFTPKTVTPGPLEALWDGAVNVVDVIATSLAGLWHIVTGGLSANNLQGPIGIAQISGDMAGQGLINFIGLIALISTAIGMLNLFPIPILDGGHLVIYAYEAIFGRPPHERVLNVAISIGFVLLMALMLFASYNDILRLIRSWT